jgi:hypothetical protein
MIQKIWIVYEGQYYHDNTFVESLHTTNSCAERKCRSDGFKLNHEERIFENDKERLYRKIEMEILDCPCWKPRVPK